MYCQVVKELTNCGAVFRVLALSATPGNDLKVSDDVTWSVVVNPPLSTTGSPAGRLKFTALTHRVEVRGLLRHPALHPSEEGGAECGPTGGRHPAD